MTTGSIAIGVDVAKLHLDAFALPKRAYRRFDNTPRGIAALVRWARNLTGSVEGAAKIVLEATGTMGWALIAALDHAGLRPNVVNPARIKAFRAAEGKLAKTDRLDAELIARFAVIMSEEARPAPSAQQLEIKSLSARRRQIGEMIGDEKRRLQQAFDAASIDSVKAAIAWLRAEQKRIERKLEDAIAADAAAKRRDFILQSISGVGVTIAGQLIADLPELGALNRHEIAALAGVAPQANDSGARTGRAHLRGGRPQVRTALYLAAFNAVRVEGPFRDFYQRQRAAGKPYRVALIATARKIVVLANSLIKNDTPWSGKIPDA